MAWLGAAPAFWINGVSFGAVIGSLLLVRTQPAAKQRGAGAAGGMRAALDFIRSQPRIQDLLVFVMLLVSKIPYFATQSALVSCSTEPLLQLIRRRRSEIIPIDAESRHFAWKCGSE